MSSYVQQNLQIIGLNKVLDPTRPSVQRVIWGILLLGGLCFLVYHMNDRVQYFSSSPILVDMNIDENDTIYFPAITICQVNPVMLLNDPLERRVDHAIKWFPKFRDRGPPPNREYGNYDDYIKKMRMDMKRTNNSAGYNLARERITDEEMTKFNYRSFLRKKFPDFQVIGCSGVKDPTLRDGFKCSAKNFTFAWNKDLYWQSLNLPCYTMNILQGDGPWLAGIDSFIALTLPGRVSGKNITYRLAIHDITDSPRLRESNIKIYPEGDGTGPKTTTRWDIKFKKTHIERVSSRCTNKPLKYFKGDKYNVLKCKAECLVDKMLEEMCDGCYVPLEVQYFDIKKICHPYDWWKCYKKVWKKRFEYNRVCNCLPKCKRSFYEHYVDHYLIKDRSIYKSLDVLNDTGRHMKLYIKYLTTRYSTIKQREAFTFLRLMAEVGGALGLFLGIRILTLAQVFDVLIVTLCCKKKTDNNSNKKGKVPGGKNKTGGDGAVTSSGPDITTDDDGILLSDSKHRSNNRHQPPNSLLYNNYHDRGFEYGDGSSSAGGAGQNHLYDRSRYDNSYYASKV